MGKLNDRRIDSILSIAAISGAGGFATFAPTPALEVPKQVVLGAADITMCLTIWRIYFKEEMSDKSLLEIMGGAGLVATVAGGAGWVIAKGATGLLHELGNALGPLGWATSGLVATSGTAALGLAWMTFCDKRYRKLFPSNEKTSLSDLKRMMAALKQLFQGMGVQFKDRFRQKQLA